MVSLISEIHDDLEKGALRLMTEYRARLFVDAVRLCEDKVEAEDLVSRTFSKAIFNLDSYKEDDNLYGWMKTIMVNIHRNDLARPVARGTTPVSSDALEMYAGADNSTDEQILKNSDHDVLREAIDQLDPEYRKMVSMYYYNELSLKEIASFFRTSTSSVSRKLEIARKIISAKVGTQLGKKPVAILLAAILGIGSLFGAWKAAEVIWPEVLVSPETYSAEMSQEIESQSRQSLSSDEVLSRKANSGSALAENDKAKENTEKGVSMNMKTIRLGAAAIMSVAGGVVGSNMGAMAVAGTALTPAPTGALIESSDVYRRVDYIESSGTQYIRTGVFATRPMRVVMDFQLVSVPKDGSAGYCGAGSNDGQFELGATSTSFCLRYGSWTNWKPIDADQAEVPVDLERHVFDISDGSQLFDGIEFAQASFNGPTEKYDLTLFKVCEQWGILYPLSMRLYSFQTYEDGVLTHDFVPCYRKSDGVVGLYDQAEGVSEADRFKVNAGQGTFTKGPIYWYIPEVEPGDYEKYDYQSDLTFAEAGLSGAISNIPVLVRLSPKLILGFDYEKCGENGSELAFASVPDGKWLDYEVEKWDVSGESLVWVLVPSLSSMTHLRLYWGLKDGQSVPESKAAQTWKGGGYAAVWHFNSLGATDSTWDNAVVNHSATLTPGPIGDGLSIGRSSEYLEAVYDQKAPWAQALAGRACTMSFWMNLKSSIGYPHLFNWGPSGDLSGFNLCACTSLSDARMGTALWGAASAEFMIEHDEVDVPSWVRSISYLDQWRHVTISWQTDDEKDASDNSVHHICFYYDGKLARSYDVTSKSDTLVYCPAEASPLMIGDTTDANHRLSSGKFDELRLSNVARDANYVATSYRAMADTSFVTRSEAVGAIAPTRIGGDEGVPSIILQDVDEISSTSARLSWNLVETGVGETVEVLSVCAYKGTGVTVTNMLSAAAGVGEGAATLTGLAPSRDYSVRLLARNGSGLTAESLQGIVATLPSDGSAVAPFSDGYPVLSDVVLVTAQDVFPCELTVSGELLATGATSGVRVFVAYLNGESLLQEVEASVEGAAFVARIPSGSLSESLAFTLRAESQAGMDILREQVRSDIFPAQDITYVWKESVLTGDFENASCWTPSSTPSYGYPRTVYSRADFSALGTESPYLITVHECVTNEATGAPIPEGVRLTLRGEKPGTILAMPLKLSIQSATIVLSGLSLQYSSYASGVGLDRGETLRLEAGAMISCGNFAAGSARGGVLEIGPDCQLGVHDNLTLGSDMKLRLHGWLDCGRLRYSSTTTEDLELVFDDPNSLMLIWAGVEENSAASPLHTFVIPEQGYVKAVSSGRVAPLCQQETYSETVKAFPQVGGVRLRVDPSSPALRKRQNTPEIIPLVSFDRYGIRSEAFAFDEMPKANRGNSFVTLYDGGTSTTGTRKTGIGVKMFPSRGLVILIY